MSLTAAPHFHKNQESLEPTEHVEHVMVLMDLETVLVEPMFPT